MSDESNVWRKCSTCKKDLLFGQPYQVCSVSTCRTHKTNYAFCSVMCWDAHLPVERHRGDSASAIEKRAPRRDEVAAQTAQPTGKRTLVQNSTSETSEEDEILVVVSKVRKYIADRSGMNTSAGVYKVLTEKIKQICDQSIEEARRQSRKTVLDRDVP